MNIVTELNILQVSSSSNQLGQVNLVFVDLTSICKSLTPDLCNYRFIVDRRIFVVGFGLYGSIHGPSEYQVNIQIIHTGSGRLLGSNEISFSSDGTNATFRVMFKEPIEIQPNTNYTASGTLKGLDSHYGTKGLRKVSVECPTGGKVTFQFSYAAGNNNGTSVEDGQIPEIIFYT